MSSVLRGEGAGEPRVQELEHVLRLQQVAQPVLAQIVEGSVRGQRALRELLDGLGEEDLASKSSRQQSGEAVERIGQVVAVCVGAGFTRVQGHADAQRTERAPLLAAEQLLSFEGRSNRRRRRGKCNLGCIAYGLEADAVVGVDGRVE